MVATPPFTLKKCERLLVFNKIPFILSAGTLQLHVCPSLNYKFKSQIEICPLLHLFGPVIFYQCYNFSLLWLCCAE